MKMRLAVLLLMLCGFYRGAGGAAEGGFDVVTMRNGEIHNGTVAQERFHLNAPYGLVSIPYGRMLRLEFGDRTNPDRIITRSGDHFSGSLSDEKLVMLRTLGPMLPLDSADISDISFATRKARSPGLDAPDLVILDNGDLFAARVLTSDFLVMGDSGINMVPRAAIHYLDVASLVEGEPPLIQITRNDGRVNQGRLSIPKVRLKTGFGDSLEVDVAHVSALALRINHSGRRSGHLFRQRFNPQDFIQDTMRDGSHGPAMLALRGGLTVRGDSRGDGDSDEQPPRTVRLKPFAIGIHEVTFEEYDRFCEDTRRRKPDDQDWGRGTRPVVNVTWKDAVAYTQWLSRRTEKTYRLPTDAEWEYAARGGTETRYWWGDELEPARANCAGCGGLWSGEKSAPVGRFPPNPFGLHDTAGNVFEWVADCWNDSYAEAPEDGSALDTPGCGKRVIRGGAWSFPPHEIRSANRWRDFPSRSSDDTGFRVARELD